mmetsp:Transcript_20768/g.35554  ORF Transcript_20768/g.35554 Transcript_20768/m.35554 type:complete len:128 (+) Transcript_20768:52-435(+)|eukprot:CAMPEP_0206155832 /NCGR_PEP_ID=MMETSP1474-20131121/2412_1 /ASSEMBLY_ACC=CAM_ASM_001110 /TAXON_ID=97495 /ORGANISM="Imantonia sp., Strain RCC918" /LENGTH=127 /DNA_ID=CAMNT_0053554619 /DNA_START=48 /DNA_END=431 /DNA_ORIENTATION=-
MLALCLSANAFSAPTVQVKTPPVVARASPMHMMAGETSSRRAILSAASLLAIPFAAQAKPEDYVGGYTTTKYEETYTAGKAKCFTSGATAPEACAGPGGDPKDPKIYFGAPAPAQEKAAPKAEPEAK